MKFFLEKAAENLRSGLDFQESGELKKALILGVRLYRGTLIFKVIMRVKKLE